MFRVLLAREGRSARSSFWLGHLLQKGGPISFDAKGAAKPTQSLPYRYERVDIDRAGSLPVGTCEATVTIHDRTTAKDAVARIAFTLQ